MNGSAEATAGDRCVGFFGHCAGFAQALGGVLRSTRTEKLGSFMGLGHPSLRLL